MKCSECGREETDDLGVTQRMVDAKGNPNHGNVWPIYREDVCDECWFYRIEKYYERRMNYDL